MVFPGKGFDEPTVHYIVTSGVSRQYGEQARSMRVRRAHQHQPYQPRLHLSAARVGLRRLRRAAPGAPLYRTITSGDVTWIMHLDMPPTTKTTFQSLYTYLGA